MMSELDRAVHAGAWNLGEMTLSAWFTALPEAFRRCGQDWGITLGTYPRPSEHGWVVACGRYMQSSASDSSTASLTE